MELFYLQLTILAFLLTIGAFLLTVLASLLTIGAFFAYSGKVRIIRALTDCKQRSLTVSKEAPTVSKKASPKKYERDDRKLSMSLLFPTILAIFRQIFVHIFALYVGGRVPGISLSARFSPLTR